MKKAIIILCSMLLCACVSSTYLAKQQYMLQSTPPNNIVSKPINASLTIEPTLAAQPYDGVQFVYRLRNSRFITDYYNIFMTAPATQLTNIITDYLQQTKLFANTNNASLILPAKYRLKTQLVKLYADYSDDKMPKAVMAIQFILLDKQDRIVYTKILAAHAPLARKSTQALVTAWNRDLDIILGNFTLQVAQQFSASTMQASQTMPAAANSGSMQHPAPLHPDMMQQQPKGRQGNFLQLSSPQTSLHGDKLKARKLQRFLSIG